MINCNLSYKNTTLIGKKPATYSKSFHGWEENGTISEAAWFTHTPQADQTDLNWEFPN